MAKKKAKKKAKVSVQRRKTPKRSAMGENPLDAYMAPRGKAAVRASKRNLEPAPAATPPPAKKARKAVAKERVTVHFPPELLEELRDAVVYHSREGGTLASFVEAAVRRELARRLKGEKLNAYPKRKAPLKTGRPVGS